MVNVEGTPCLKYKRTRDHISRTRLYLGETTLRTGETCCITGSFSSRVEHLNLITDALPRRECDDLAEGCGIGWQVRDFLPVANDAITRFRVGVVLPIERHFGLTIATTEVVPAVFGEGRSIGRTAGGGGRRGDGRYS